MKDINKKEERLISELEMLSTQVEELKASQAELRKAKDAVRDSERFLSNIFSSIQDGISVLDNDFNIVRVNPIMREWYSHASPLEGKKCYEAYHGRSEYCEICPSRQAILSGESAYEIVPRVGPTGETVGWLGLYAFPLVDASTGQTKGIIEYVRDITDRKRAEEELKFRSLLLDRASDSVFVHDFQGNLLYVNQAAYKTRGYSKEELLKLPLRKLDVPEYADLIKKRMEALTKKGSAKFESAHYKRDGSIMQVEVQAQVLEFQGEKVIASIVRDITQRKSTEEAIKESENMYRTIFGNTGSATVIIEEDTTLSLVNAEFEKLSGYSKEELEGKKSWTEFVVKEDLETMKKYHQERREENGGAPRNYEFRFLHRSGEPKHIYLNAAMIPGTKKSVASLLDITEAKRAEEALRETSDYLENLLDYANAPIIVWNPELKITRFNRAFEYLTGLGAEKALGKKLDILFPKIGRKESLDHIRRAMMGERWETVEIPILRVDGKIRTVLWNSANIYARDGKSIVATIAQGQDITERVEVEEALKISEEKYRTMIEHSNDVIWTLDTQGNFLYVNKRAEEVSGYKLEDWRGKSFAPMIPVADLPRIENLVRETFSGKSVHYEVEVLRKDGSIFVLSVNSAPFYSKGEVVGIVNFGHDITQRRQSERALRESENKYRSLFENSKDVVYISSKDGAFIDINPSGAELFGYSREELLSSVKLKKIYADFKDRKKFMVEIDRCGFIKDYPIEFRKKDGTVLNTLVTSVVRKDSEGNIVGYQGIIRDVTEQKRAEEELKKSMAKLKKAMEETIQAMKLTAEMRDPYTAGHQKRVAKLASSIAEEMGLPPDMIDGIHMAAVIHDIGKVYVPAEILSKPGLLTEVEFNMVKTHPQVGYDILKTIDFPWPIAQIVLQHHERLDGSTYPLGLTGKSILLEARILGVADVVEAMASYRPYRPALGVEKALREISDNKGQLYDPDVVNACLSVFKQGFKFDRE